MKTHRPTTASQRHMRTPSYRGVLSDEKPHKSLTKGGKQKKGRNHHGRITSRHKGGGHKRKFRAVDFGLEKQDIPARIETLEYDPMRSGFIARVVFHDGERRYILAPQSVSVGETILFSEEAHVSPGNRLPLAKMPVGTFVYNIEVQPGGGAKLVRSAGTHAQVIGHDRGYTHIRMPSTEIRKVLSSSWASVGEVSNEEHKLRRIGKAGRTRWLGVRPTVRGVAMGAHDHPYGGGEGRTGLGRRRLVTKWGKSAGKYQRTRKPKKYSNPLIVSRRRVGKKRK